MTDTGRIVIPYGNAAGQAAFEVFCRIAQRLCREAQDATDAYIAATFPDSKTIKTAHTDGTYHRTVRTANGETRTIIYDYQTHETWLA